MNKEEKKVQLALGTLTIKERIQYFRENALKGINKVFDDKSVTLHEFKKMSREDWQKVADNFIREVEEKILKVFDEVAIEGESTFSIVFNTTYHDNWSCFTFDDYDSFDDECQKVMEEILDALGVDAYVLGELIHVDSVTRCDWVDVNSDT